MLLGGDVRVCIAYSETDNDVENIVKDALENDKVGCIWPRHLFFMSQCGRPQTDCSQAVGGRLSIAIAGSNGEVRRPMNPSSRCT